MRPSKCADALAHAETEASRANGAVRAAEGRRMDARRRFAAFHRTNMSRSRVLQGLLLYLVSQTKESPPFSLYCFSPYKAVAAPRCRTSPSLWPVELPSPRADLFSPHPAQPPRFRNHRPTALSSVRTMLTFEVDGRISQANVVPPTFRLARFLRRRRLIGKTSFP